MSNEDTIHVRRSTTTHLLLCPHTLLGPYLGFFVSGGKLHTPLVLLVFSFVFLVVSVFPSGATALC